ncbi:hypothetical protein V6N13_063642 [Hibiscus sabdariffa]
MLLLLLCKCFDVLPKQDDKGDASNRDNGSFLSRNLGGDSDLAELLSAETCTPSSLLRAWALGLVFEWSQPPLDALLVLGCSGEYSDENEIPFSDSFLLPGQKISTALLSSSLSAVMTWYRLCLLASLYSGSSSSGLEGMSRPTLLPALALSFLCAGESGVWRSAMAQVVGVGAAERIGTAMAGLEGIEPIGCI